MRSRNLPALLLMLLAIGVAARPTPVFEGVDANLASRVLERAPGEAVRCDSPRWVVRAWSTELTDELRQALRARSHYDPQMAVEIERAPDCWTLQIGIDPGEQTQLRAFAFEITGAGADDDAFLAVVREQRPREGRPFREAEYEAIKRGLRRVALERGYFDSRFARARVDVWTEELAADVDLAFETGDRYMFGETRIELEPDVLGEQMLERFVLWEPGAPYSIQDVQRLRRLLLRSGYFETVEVSPQIQDRIGGAVDVDLNLGMRRRHQISGGIGFTTDYGPRLRTDYQNRYLNRRGHQGGVGFNLSPVLQELQTDYRLPLRGREDSWLVVDASVSREDTDTAETLVQSVGVRRIRPGPWGTRLTESLHLQREDFDVGRDDDVAILLMPGLAINKTRQRRVRPLEIGWRLDGQIRGAAEPLATSNFLQLYGRGELAVPIGNRARGIARVELGTTLADALATLPSTIRYFAGGDRSIRGYPLDSLGPTDDEGEPRGGRHLAIASLELERAVSGNWSVAVFSDYGGAFSDFSERPSTGVGVGARWLSPVGPIRIDLAHPVDKGGYKVRLHVGIGTTFQ